MQEHRLNRSASDENVQPRPRELEDWLNFNLYHPLALRIAKTLATTLITPNMVSVASGSMIVLAALAYTMWTSWVGVLLGLLLHMSWHILDGVDGDLARLTSRTSSVGEIVDGICDYAGHIVLYVMLGSLLASEIGPSAWLFMWAAGLGRIVQAMHYEVQRRQYQFWVYATPWLRSEKISDGPPRSIVGMLGVGYLRLSGWLAPRAIEVDRLIEQSSGQAYIDLQNLIRSEMAIVLRWTQPLSANYRTLALGASMFAGSPLYFFIFEAFILGIWFFISVGVARRAASKIIAYAPAKT